MPSILNVPIIHQKIGRERIEADRIIRFIYNIGNWHQFHEIGKVIQNRDNFKSLYSLLISPLVKAIDDYVNQKESFLEFGSFSAFRHSNASLDSITLKIIPFLNFFNHKIQESSQIKDLHGLSELFYKKNFVELWRRNVPPSLNNHSFFNLYAIYLAGKSTFLAQHINKSYFVDLKRGKFYLTPYDAQKDARMGFSALKAKVKNIAKTMVYEVLKIPGYRLKLNQEIEVLDNLPYERNNSFELMLNHANATPAERKIFQNAEAFSGGMKLESLEAFFWAPNESDLEILHYKYAKFLMVAMIKMFLIKSENSIFSDDILLNSDPPILPQLLTFLSGTYYVPLWEMYDEQGRPTVLAQTLLELVKRLKKQLHISPNTQLTTRGSNLFKFIVNELTAEGTMTNDSILFKVITKQN